MKMLFALALVVAASACTTYSPAPEQTAAAKEKRQTERDVAAMRRANDDAMKTIGGF